MSASDARDRVLSGIRDALRSEGPDREPAPWNDPRRFWCDQCASAWGVDRAVEAARREGEGVGAAVVFGLMGMAEAIRERTWRCSHLAPGAPGECPGVNFIPEDPMAPWVCWLCGVQE